MGLIFWVIMWCKYQPKQQHSGTVTPTPQVQLIGFYSTSPPQPSGAPPPGGGDGGHQNDPEVAAAAKAQEIEGGVLPS